jgi:hypothetical protein
VFGVVMAWVFVAVLAEGLPEAGASAQASAYIKGQRSKPAGRSCREASTLLRSNRQWPSLLGGFRRVILVCAGQGLLNALSAWVMIGRGAERDQGCVPKARVSEAAGRCTEHCTK